MVDVLTHTNFLEQLNTTFEAENQDTRVPLELTEVSDIKLRGAQEEFSIVFRGPADRFLQQGTYAFHHPSFGVFELFIVPIRQQDNDFHYQAVFNRFN